MRSARLHRSSCPLYTAAHLTVRMAWRQGKQLWKQVSTGSLLDHYYWQVQHQLMVARATVAHVYVFDGTVGTLLEVAPEQACWEQITEAWEAFMRCIESDTPPPLTDRDTLEPSDSVWQQAAQAYVAAKRTAEAATTQLDAAKSALVDLTSHPSESGFGVSVTKYWKAGSIDYKKGAGAEGGRPRGLPRTGQVRGEGDRQVTEDGDLRREVPQLFSWRRARDRPVATTADTAARSPKCVDRYPCHREIALNDSCASPAERRSTPNRLRGLGAAPRRVDVQLQGAATPPTPAGAYSRRQ